MVTSKEVDWLQVFYNQENKEIATFVFTLSCHFIN